MFLAAVSCGKNSHTGEPEKPVVRYLEISSPVIEIDGKAQVETVGINTNYETINVSGGDTWCTYRLAGDNKSITLTIKLNDGDARQASVILTGVADEGEVTRSILVKQNKGIVEYTLDCSTIDFEASKVIDVMHQNKRLAQICQEYIYTADKSVDRQTAVLYPAAADGALDLAHGLEISTGATVAWDLSDPEADACTCTGGNGEPVKMLHICNGSISLESVAGADAVMSATLSPAVISDLVADYPDSYFADARKALGIAPEEFVMLFVGQHIWEKNPRLVIEALAQIPDVPFRMYFVGNGYAAHAMKDLVSEKGLDGKVTFVGTVTDREAITRYYAASDLFLFPSLYDNAPLVVREAAALHTPAVMASGATASTILIDRIM